MTENYFIDVHTVNAQRPQLGGLDTSMFAAFASQISDLDRLEVDRFSLLSAPSGDLRIKRVLDALTSVGVDVMNRTGFKPKQFFMRRARAYSPQDGLAAPYAVPDHSKFLGEVVDDYAQDENGIPHLKAALKPLNRDCGSVQYTRGSPILVVRGRIKTALENSGMKGLRLVEPVFKGRTKVNESEKIWVVWSSITLPPMKNLCRDESGDFYKYLEREQIGRGCKAWEGEGIPAEFHYRQDEISRIGDFDLALTVERFGDFAREPCLVGSRNFFRFMIEELGQDLGGIPVHLDEDDTIPWIGPYCAPWEHLNKIPNWLNFK
jgi:hypothetical protein